MADSSDLTPKEMAVITEVATALKQLSLANPRRQASARLRFRGGRLLDVPVRYVWASGESSKED